MREKICGIYSIINTVNGKRIIGQSKDIYKRWTGYRNQLDLNKYDNVYLQRSWNKYGKQNFKFEIIFLCSIQDLNETEIRFIREYKSTNRKFGYNIEEGGNRHNQSEETKLKLSRAHTGKKATQETKRKMSEAKRGVHRPLSVSVGLKNNKRAVGYKHTEETKQKMSIDRMGINNNNFGKKHSVAARLKMSQVNIGRKHTEEWKINHSKNMMGNKFSLGHKHSEESKQKMSESHKDRKPITEETKRKISEKKFQYWANKKLNTGNKNVA
jgi:group I intron endonuclease